jgi:hypothetical protein
MADMPLSKWVSSHPEALKDIPKEEQSKDMFLEDPDGHSTLGVGWKPDKLTFKPKKASEGNLTRRRIASIVSGIFDPLGWLAPKSLEGRIVLQGISLKKLNIKWDTDLDKMSESSEEMRAQLKRFRKWEQELPMLDQISYPRAIYKPKPIKARQLQIFTDGSQHAYAAMAYVKITYDDGEKSLIFLCCARRITPTNGRSTPETELLGAVTGAELGQRLATLLDITGSNVRYWTDSTPVLTWIRKAGKKNKVFVVHRTTAIHDMTDTERWDYVPTKVNPADLPTRGCTIKDLVNFTLFWRGPAFVMEDEDRWPNMIIRVTDEERFPKDAILWFCTMPQPQSWIKQCSTVLFGGGDTPSWITQCGAIKTSLVGLQQAVKPATDQERTALAVIRKAHKAAEAFPVGSFGKWSRAVRTMARMKVIMRKQSNPNGTEIRPEALMEAAATLIIMAQVQVHEEDIKYFATHEGRWNAKSPIHGHGVYFDQYGMMRVSSRAQLQQDLPLATMFPIWFPKGTWVGRLILYFEHGRNHSKTKRLAQEFMTRFFCNGLYQAVGTINKHCMTCRKKHGPGGAQIMGQVPDRKMGSLKQFSLVSMDACGHFTVKVLNTSMKVWVLVLACLQTKAIHLEILEGLKTDEVINALERAVARRGNFEELHADNFASFIAAKTIITREQQASLLHASLLQKSKAQQDDKAGGSTGKTVRLPQEQEQDSQPEAQTRGRAKTLRKQMLQEAPEIDWEKVQDGVSRKVWKWTFSKPYSSEGNGVAEAMVKLAKEAMSTTFRQMDVRLNEFRTIVAKAEARVNSRPIVTFKPNDCWENTEILTPQHFSVGMLGGEVAPEATVEDCENLPTRWAIVQQHIARWDRELQRTTAAMMLSNHKWATMVAEMKVGTLVLIMNENAKRYDWPLGLVTRVIRSQDGIVRAAVVRTRSEEGHKPSTLTRNVRELVPLTVFDQQKHCPEVSKKPRTIIQETDQVIPKPAELHKEIPKKDTAGYGIKSNRKTRVKVPTILKTREN